MASARIAALGGAGVDLFFVISGFVMIYSARDLFARRNGPWIFLLRRIVRIVPLYWLVTIIMIGYASATLSLPFGKLFHSAPALCSFLFFPCPIPSTPVLVLGWTLNYEIYFYLVLALAIPLPRRAAVIAVVTLFAAMALAGCLLDPPQPLAFWTDPFILEFCFGMLIAEAYVSGFRIPSLVAAALVAIALTWYALSLDMAGGRVLNWGVPGALVVAAATLRDTQPAARGFFARSIAVIGDASYSLYLTHLLVLLALQPLLAPIVHLPGAIVICAVVLVTAAIGVAILSYRWFEKPLIDAARRWGRPVRPGAQASP